MEGKRLLRDPVVGLPWCFTFRSVRVGGGAGSEQEFLLLVGFGLVCLVSPWSGPLVGRAATRLEQTELLLTTLAVGPDRRSVGHAFSTLAGGASAVVWAR